MGIRPILRAFAVIFSFNQTFTSQCHVVSVYKAILAAHVLITIRTNQFKSRMVFSSQIPHTPPPLSLKSGATMATIEAVKILRS